MKTLKAFLSGIWFIFGIAVFVLLAVMIGLSIVSVIAGLYVFYVFAVAVVVIGALTLALLGLIPRQVLVTALVAFVLAFIYWRL